MEGPYSSVITVAHVKSQDVQKFVEHQNSLARDAPPEFRTARFHQAGVVLETGLFRILLICA